MDYDDNDFQSQNLHLAGEGNTKFPPVLQPYALPKFDFDDSHLRFDSLVETEVFLGIEGNEDSRWIEDFSRGSSGIEFNSSATESCSIARRNNVWSEATSSESVEMLLKSVGQEEIILRPTIVKESDASDELGCLTKQMEPSLIHDDNILPKSGDAKDLQSKLPQNEIPENFSGLKHDVLVGQPLDKQTSQAQVVEFSLDGRSVELDHNAVSVKSSFPVVEESSLADGKANEASTRGVDMLADEYLGDKMQEDSSALVMHVDKVVTCTQDKITSAEVSDQDLQHQRDSISNTKSDELQVRDIEHEEKFLALSGEAKMNDQNLDENVVESDALHLESPLGSTSVLDSAKEGNAIENHVTNVEETSGMLHNGDSDLHMVEKREDVGSSITAKPGECHNVVLLKDTEVGDPSKVSTHEATPLAFRGDTSDERYDVQGCDATAGMDTIVQLTHGQESKVEKDDLLQTSCQLDNEILVSKSERSLPSMEENKVSKVEDNKNNNLHGEAVSSVTLVRSSPDLLGETPDTGTRKVVNDVSEVPKENLIAESSQTCKEDKMPPSDSSIGDGVVGVSLIIDGVGSSSFHEASNATSEDAAVLLPSGNDMTTDGVIDSQEVQMTASVGRLTHLNEKESTGTKTSSEARISTAMESLEVDTKSGCISETEKAAGKVLQEMIDQSLSMAKTHIAKSQTVAQTTFANEVNQECARGIEAHAVICDIAAKMGDGEKAAPNIAEPILNNDMMLTPSVSLPLEESCLDAGQIGLGDNDTTVSVDKNCSEIGTPSTNSEVLKLNEGSFSSLLSKSQTNVCATESGSATGNTDKPTGSSDMVKATKISESVNEKGVKASAEEGVNRSTGQIASSSEVIDVDANNAVSISGGIKKGNTTTQDEKSFSFEISSLADLSGKDTSNNSECFPSISTGKVTPIVESSPSTSGLGQMEAKISQNISYGSPQVSDGQITRGGSKGTRERKTRRLASRAAGKETAKRGSHVKEIALAKQSERVEKSTNVNVSLSPSAIFQFVQSNEMSHYGHVEGSSTKPIFLLTATSGLPDLNTSVPPSTLFQQPFTDLQQVQLRAQIFVYGALIQGTAPEEAHMISAFGGPDGGRGIWDNAWRVCMERLQGQKSLPITPETPLQSRSGVRAPEQAIKQSALQSKSNSSPLGRSSSKGASTVVSSVIPVSSPLWNIPTPSDALQPNLMPRGSVLDYQQALSTLHPYQTPPVRNFVGHNTSWISQFPFRGPWMASPQTSADASTRVSVLPNTEMIKSTPLKESSVLHSSGIKHSSTGSVVHSAVATSSPLLDPKEVTVLPRQSSTDPKSRRRKKTSVSENHGQILLQSQSQPEVVSTPAVISHLSNSITLTTATAFASKAPSEKIIISDSPILCTDNIKRAGQIIEQGATLSEETLSKVKEARLQAENATAFSAAAVSHCQEVWSQLEKQQGSGLESDVEAQLASAAVSIAAAAAVAKAAAAIANVASNAALQAKQMAEEALVWNGYGNPNQGSGTSFPDSVNIVGKATPASMLKGENRTSSSSSIIVAAKEAVRKRVEAASAATKRAENMDAIVKAAELAAEAISQAGKIVAMGDALPLSELVEAGPEGLWKASRESSERVVKSNNTNREHLNSDRVGGGPDISRKNSKEGSSDKKEAKITTYEKSVPTEMPKQLMEDQMRLGDGILAAVTTNEKDSRGQKGRKVSDLAKTIGVVPESETGSRFSTAAQNEGDKVVETFKQNSITEGSTVEVLKDTDGFKAAWFPAKVLSLDDGKAYVSYNELQTDDGQGQLTEWVELLGEGEKAPRIRMARPVTAVRYEGTRKRRRAAMGDYNWSVGDRVDAWIRNSWWEGIVTEKIGKDGTTLTIQLPAQGETSVVKAWDLRPSLIWKDGEWIEWSSLRENDAASRESDMPQEKRLKLGSPAVEAKGKDKMLKSKDASEAGKPEELRLLDLAANEKLFNIGKDPRNQNKPDSLRTIRTGLQKEGSRVIFGIPKPGKKRKFMEVSKHYVAEGSKKINEANDSAKFAKYMMPQGSGSRGWKSSRSDLKEKRVAETKPRPLKSGKQQSVSGRTIPGKNNLLSAVSAPDVGTFTDHSAKVKDSVSHPENASGKQHNQSGMGSLSSAEGAVEAPILFSSLGPSTDGSSKKVSTSSAKPERVNKGKLAPAGTGKLSRIEEDKVFNANPAKSMLEVVEPRRSNRRIQPTSRLLEGLQSSLIISKIPSVSHDKGSKSQNRNASRGINHG